MVVAMIALGAAMAGVANGGIGGSKLAPTAAAGPFITGAHVLDGSLTGADINQATLTAVANAAHANGADFATNAGHATSADSATNATNAGNANTLGGLGPNGYQKVPTTTQHLVIPGTVLIDGTTNAGKNTTVYTGPQWCTTMNGSDYFAAIDLPQGATITGMRHDYVDDGASASGNGTTYITRVPLTGRGGTYNDLYYATLANTGSAGAAATATATVISAAAAAQPVDNTKWAYTIIGFSGATGAGLCSIDITYTIPQGFSSAREPSAAQASVHGQAPGTGTLRRFRKK